MAKYPVLNAFVDKNTAAYYESGSVYETKDEERASDLQDMEFIGEEMKPQRKGRATDEHRKTAAPGDVAKSDNHS
ncbi:hypothetical protein DFP93_102123 [Aneurinibacillus soli]|uniref:Uncharacterized protein n=1 Tax=Aneurinibacillus soli TaxID=1500254 RepID=A0A0U5BA77_9BACL|nr:hypothetical protein [Aneurinibacillus soli]PYE63439.1 hypothetical protein DFP93_102123 [Aneurinibacillus soli]BAU27629.1 hypothetical protein CB4_01803 [Aneurinibacillus soli]